MLYTIGDLHLSLGSDKPMDAFGGAWVGYVDKLQEGFSVLKDEDLCVLCGDISWGMDLESALPDFKFIDAMPGRKLIVKGNHDYWWSTASKIQRFFQENAINTIDILHNKCVEYEGRAVCGTRGWFYTDNTGNAHDEKIMKREVGRLETSLAMASPEMPKLVFLHYPPIYNAYRCREMLDVMKKYEVSDCWYGHIHSAGHTFAVRGEREGINFHMISSDYIGFKPKPVP